MLTRQEQDILNKIIRRGWTDEIRKACAAKLIREWQSVMRTEHLTISWLDEPVIKPLPKRTDWSGLEQQADEYLPEELKSKNMRLYSESREDHSWLQSIQDERSKQEEHAQMQEQLQQLKNKYKRNKK